jgi:hypothetical protein
LRERQRTFEVSRADAIRRQPRMNRKHLSEIQEVFHVLLLTGFQKHWW